MHSARFNNSNRVQMTATGAWLLACLLSGGLQSFGQDNDADQLYKRAISAYEAGMVDEALQLANQAIASSPKEPKLYLARGYIHQYERRHQKAVDDFSKAIELNPNSIEAWQRRGEERFKLAQFKESVADFERVIQLRPQRAPYHWQLGISYYYAGQHQKGMRIFEKHQTVNRNDVENAVWHYLCAAKVHGLDEAGKRLLTISNDARTPMMEIYALFEGRGTEEQVLKRAHQGRALGGARARQIFYAHLYLGLYHQARGNADKAYNYIKKAAQQYKENGYMGQAARVHRLWLERKRKAP